MILLKLLRPGTEPAETGAETGQHNEHHGRQIFQGEDEPGRKETHAAAAESTPDQGREEKNGGKAVDHCRNRCHPTDQHGSCPAERSQERRLFREQGAAYKKGQRPAEDEREGGKRQ